ncbi:prepilin peptidase [Halochromatium roseum]|uniref:prepilin peptidase n=1 Tax=Halochromatium roseum TaxID=391920 RepID=UPI003B833CAF
MDIISLFEQAPALLYLTTALFGLAVGSFLNVLILRLPRIMEQEWREECAELLASARVTASQQDATEPAATTSQQPPPTSEMARAPRLSLSRPGSHCPSCGTAIRPLDNIPILSWMRLRGRCRACEATIAIRYPLVEALTALLSVVVVWQLGPTSAALAALILTWGLIALAIIDFDTQLLPDSLTLPLLWLGLLLSLGGTFTDATSAILGATAGYLLLWLVFQAFRITTGKEGMGRGDFKLLALFGAWLGWQAVPQIILLSALPGAIVGVLLIASGRQQAGQPIPYGPFLAIAGWISLLWGDTITGAYLSWSGLA